ncbi:MAG TPA: peptide chain release factor 2 [Candidatus Bilophila faecipullorum]|uniref:Peptide chain release factor 2 n=1 Tax=Candidatus Bilophila faecipullorum TaxID=2838482 RepID=A0A9D1R0F6_9BACT|nr:peptide chain release factor 2 [uncultured Bilophila sp.]HIW79173.1 peptide chain release factor 2 [Candidatus Bilophila faecipullorum]
MLQLADLKSRIAALSSQFETLWGRLDQPSQSARLEEIEKQLSAPDAWSAPEKLTPVLREKSRLESELGRLAELKNCHNSMLEWQEMAQELSGGAEIKEGDEAAEALESLEAEIERLGQLLEETEMNLLLSSEEDHMDAILEIHPGAGGTEAQDWAQMLQRLYLRWADAHGYQVEELDFLPGDEAGIKSVTMRISGENVYGFLKGERGIHRLIRISPFDSSGRRHTSFASVDVIPDAGDDIEIEIKESDLRIDIFCASGPGGQGVNTTYSAVRITHLPSGISVQCQNERSQHHNKDSAMRILRGRLYELELSKRDAARQAEYAGKNAISFGSQIRTYTLQPYRLVKDHRSNCEIGDTDAVLDGRIDKLLRDYLLWRHTNK